MVSWLGFDPFRGPLNGIQQPDLTSTSVGSTSMMLAARGRGCGRGGQTNISRGGQVGGRGSGSISPSAADFLVFRRKMKEVLKRKLNNFIKIVKKLKFSCSRNCFVFLKTLDLCNAKCISRIDLFTWPEW